jgi:hypothetical protein
MREDGERKVNIFGVFVRDTKDIRDIKDKRDMRDKKDFRDKKDKKLCEQTYSSLLSLTSFMPLVSLKKHK